MAVSFDTGESKVVRRDYFLVDPTEIVLKDDDNTRAFPVSDSDVDDMVELFRKQTQLQPILCRKLPDKRLKVVFGYRRLKAALKLHAEDPSWMVKVTVDPAMNELDALLASIGENFRVATNMVDHSKNIHSLIENFGWTVDQVAEFYKWNKTKVGEVRKVKGLNVKVQRALAAGKVALAPALMMAGLDDGDIDELLSPASPGPGRVYFKPAEADSDEATETTPDGDPLPQTLFPVVVDVADDDDAILDRVRTKNEDAAEMKMELECYLGSDSDPAPDDAPKAKRGRPRKDGSTDPATKPVARRGAASNPAPKAPARLKASAVAAKLRDKGETVKRGLSDLRKILDGREDPISLAILGYLAGTGTGEALTAVLDDAEPKFPADTVYDPGMNGSMGSEGRDGRVTEYDPSEGERAVWGVMGGV